MDKNSLLFWYPKIKDLGIRTPYTRYIKLNQKELDEYYGCEGDSCSVERIADEIEKLILTDPNLSLPIFMRTDQVSNKWFWDKSCFLQNFDNINSQIFEIICMSRCADIMGGLPIEALVVREYIPMDTRFYAFAGNMPVNPERRYFIRNGEVLCHHSYWIEGAIREPIHNDLPDNWKELLRAANTETDSEWELLHTYASKVTKTIEGFWSVDFCQAKTKEWILIDMALGCQSWHPEECKFTLEEAGE